MSELISAALGVLNNFHNEVSTWTNQGLLTSIEGHIAQIENAASQDVHAGETAVKAVLADLYGAFHGHTTVPAAPAPAPVEAAPAPAAPAEPVAAPVAADPTPASSTTTEASSAPSSTPSASTPDTAAPAAPNTPAATA